MKSKQWIIVGTAKNGRRFFCSACNAIDRRTAIQFFEEGGSMKWKEAQKKGYSAIKVTISDEVESW